MSGANEDTISMNEVRSMAVDGVDKSFLPKVSKLSFLSRSYESITMNDIPILMQELGELRKAYQNTVLFLIVPRVICRKTMLFQMQGFLKTS